MSRWVRSPSRLGIAHEVQTFIGAVDDELTSKGYIAPGLGDAVCSSKCKNPADTVSGRSTIQYTLQMTT